MSHKSDKSLPSLPKRSGEDSEDSESEESDIDSNIEGVIYSEADLEKNGEESIAPDEDVPDVSLNNKNEDQLFDTPRHNWFYTAYFRLTKIGKNISHKDLYEIPEDNKTAFQSERFIYYWEEESKKKHPSLWSAMLKTFWKSLLHIACLQLVSIILQFAIPLVLPYMTEFFQNPSVEYYWGYIYSSIVLVSTVIASIFWYKSIWQGNLLGLKIKTAFMAALYKKVVSGNITNGGMYINLFAQDASLMFFYMPYIVPAVITPITLTISLGILGWRIGVFALITLGVILVLFPFVFVAGNHIGKARFEMQKFSDERLKLENELVQGIRVIKYYVWETPLKDKIGQSREKELQKLRSIGILRSFTTLIPNITPTFCLAITFIIYGLYGPALTPDVAYTVYSLMNLIRLPLGFLAAAGILLSTLNASIDRIRIALAVKPREDYVKENEEIGLSIENASFKWDTDERITLKDINLKVREGEHIMIVGPVGNGKSSMAMITLGEIPLLSGEVKRKGSIAYVPQQAWIINATARDNILFGNDFEPKWYSKVILAAGLAPDFKQFANGDLTEVGARGVNLSGGQKQRLSIARALYSKRDLYIFDDPFSALDSHVSKHVFEHAINGLLKGKTVILTTNQLHFIHNSSQVLLMNQGTIEIQGSFNHLKNNSKTFRKLLKIYGGSSKKNNKEIAPPPAQKAPEPVVPQKEEETEIKEDEGGLIAIEEKQQGMIPIKIYRYYIKSGGTLLFTIMMLLFLCVSALRVLGSWWLTLWMADLGTATAQNGTTTLNSTQPAESSGRDIQYWVWTYFAWLLSEAIVYGVTIFIALVVFAVHGGRKLHVDLLDSLSRAVVAFFDQTPIGRIVQRLSTDMGLIDTFLPILGTNWLNSVFVIIAAIASLGFGGWYTIPIWALMMVVFYFLQARYRKTNIEIQRMEAISSAPPISTMSSTIEGLVSIRAYKVMDNFTNLLFTLIDHNNVDKYNLRLGYSWYGVSLEICTGFLIGIVFFGLSIARNYFNVDPALASLSLSSLAGVTTQFAQVFLNFTEVEVRMNSVERFNEFKKIQKEKEDAEITDIDPLWPQEGQIVFENFSFKYRKGPVVLKNLNFEIKARTKIGIVGRTGSGKSSILQALFRIEEPHAGCIKIDGLDTSKIFLSDLRKNLSIIPQDPVMFIGTLRYNLDPFNEKSDKELWNVLELVQLKDSIQKLEGGLDSPVEEDGKNFSVGQRQLLCMARALLRKTPILLLDEATASVDVETDQLIQKTVRKAFKHCTVLTIAHRINTIMDSDKVLVLDAGHVMEFDSPKNLLKKENGLFASLAKAAGLAK